MLPPDIRFQLILHKHKKRTGLDWKDRQTAFFCCCCWMFAFGKILNFRKAERRKAFFDLFFFSVDERVKGERKTLVCARFFFQRVWRPAEFVTGTGGPELFFLMVLLCLLFYLFWACLGTGFSSLPHVLSMSVCVCWCIRQWALDTAALLCHVKKERKEDGGHLCVTRS